MSSTHYWRQRPGLGFFFLYMILGLVWGFWVKSPDGPSATSGQDLLFLIGLNLACLLISGLVIFQIVRTGRYRRLTLVTFLISAISGLLAGLGLILLT